METFDYYAKQAEEAIELGDADLAQQFLDLANDVNNSNVKQEPLTEEVAPEPIKEEGEGHGMLRHIKEAYLNFDGAIGEVIAEGVGTVIDWPKDVVSNLVGDVVSTNENVPMEALKIIQDEEGTKLFSAFGKDYHYLSGEGVQKLKEINLYNVWKAEDTVRDIVLDLEEVKDMGMQETITGQLTGGFTQFIGGWVTLAPVKALKVAKDAPKLTQFGQAMLKGAVVDFSFFDAHQNRLADLAKHHGFENDFINFMAAEGNEEDSIFEGKLKNALEGSLAGAALEVTLRFMMAAARATRKGVNVFSNKEMTPDQHAEAVEKIIKEVEEIQENFKDPSEVKLKTEDGSPLIVETPEKMAQEFEAKVGAGVDTPKPKTPEVPKTKEELDLATKEERAEMGSLRSPDDAEPPKVVPIKDTVERGNQLIADLLRNADKDGILGFVKSLKEVTIRPDGFEPAAWVKALDKLSDSIDEALALVDNSAEFKVGDANAVLRKQQLVEARLSLHAQTKASHSGLGRGLVAIRQALSDSFKPNLELLYGDDLAKAQAKEIEKVIKKQKKKKKKSKEKTEIDKAAEEGGLTPSTVDELDPFIQRMLANLSRTKDVGKSWVDKFVEYGSANLLMGWKTQLINPTINGVMLKINNFETLGGSLTAVARGDKEAALRQYRRGKYQTYSLVRNSRIAGRSLWEVLKTDRQALIPDNIHKAGRASWEVLMTGKNVLDPEFKVKEEVEGAVDDVAIGKGDIDFREYAATVKKGIEAANRGEINLKEFLETIHEDMTFEDIIGNYVRLSYRGLASGDEFFKQLNFRGIYGGLIQERLLKQGKNVGIDDASFMRLIDDEVDRGVKILGKRRLKEEPLTEAEENLLGELLYSLNQTREATFTDPLGNLGKWFQKGMNEFPVMRLIMDAWFIRTPFNVFKFVGRRTPVLNLASRRFRRMMWGGNSDDRNRALFEMTYISLAMYMVYQIVDEMVDVPDGKGGTVKMYRYQGTMDHLTYNNVKNLKLTGLQPHSRYFEDTQTFHNTQRFAPMDNLLMTMVNIRDLENAGMYDEGMELVSAAFVSYLNMMKDSTFTSGMTNFINFLDDPEKSFDKYMEAKGRTFTPALLKAIGNDEGMREVDGVWEAIKSGIPFLSKNMEPKFDRLGQPMLKPNQDGLINGLSKATFLASDNAVRMEFLNMNANIADIPRKDGLLDWESEAFDVDGKSAWHRFNEVYATVEHKGKTLEEALEELITSDEYQNLATDSTMTPDLRLRGSKEGAILNILNTYEDLAKYIVAEERKDTGLLFMWNKTKEARRKALSQETIDEVETDPDVLLQEFFDNQFNRK